MAKQRARNLRVGRSDVKPAASAHVRGVRQGNQLDGHVEQREARRATGVGSEARAAKNAKGPRFPPP